MTATELSSLIATMDLDDWTDRRVLADAMEESGRDEEAGRLREYGNVADFDGRIVRVIGKAFVEDVIREVAEEGDVDAGEVTVARTFLGDGNLVIGLRVSVEATGYCETYGEC